MTEVLCLSLLNFISNILFLIRFFLPCILDFAASSPSDGTITPKTESTNIMKKILYNYMSGFVNNVFDNILFSNPVTYCIILAFGGIPLDCIWEFLPQMISHYESIFGGTRYTAYLTVCMTYVLACFVSTLLVYYVGNRHRPKFVALGLVFIALGTATFAGEAGVLEYIIRSKNMTSVENNLQFGESENIECPQRNSTSCDKSNDMNLPVYIGIPLFCIGMLFNVIGQSFFVSLGFSYIDDNTNKENTLILLGICNIGKQIGKVFGALYTCEFISNKMYLLVKRGAIRWTQQWWIGFAMIAVFSVLIAIAISIFPKHMHHKTKFKIVEIDEEDELSSCDNEEFRDRMNGEDEGEEEGEGEDEDEDGDVYIQISGVPIGAIAVGMWTKYFKPTPEKLLVYCSIVLTSCFVLCLTSMALGCQTPDIKKEIIRENTCMDGCDCDSSEFNPICDLDSGVTYFSECHAACRVITQLDDYSNLWDCGCFDSENGLVSNITRFGKCSSNHCTTKLWLYIVILFVLTVFVASASNILVFISMRCVEKRDKAFGLSIQTSSASILGFVDNKGVFHKKMNEHYFLTDPAVMIWTHFPCKDDIPDYSAWQLLEKSFSLDLFNQLPKVTPYFFTCNVRVRSPAPPKNPVKFKNQVEIKLASHDVLRYKYKLYSADDSSENNTMNNFVFCQLKEDRLVGSFAVSPPIEGVYFLKLYAKPEKELAGDDTNSSLQCVATFLLECEKSRKYIQHYPINDMPWGPTQAMYNFNMRLMNQSGPVIVTWGGRRQFTFEVNHPMVFQEQLYNADNEQLDHKNILGREEINKQVLYSIQPPKIGYYKLMIYGLPKPKSTGKVTLRLLATFLIDCKLTKLVQDSNGEDLLTLRTDPKNSKNGSEGSAVSGSKTKLDKKK
ncbi:Solute carrier organic anion transporter family member 1C1 [Nymphon striatum]|nr:Solute carrier organic anion transporter family member 1C1 [Nymphon striatum]